MNERRQDVLSAIRRAGRPVGVREIAGQLGVHPNTVRFHLDALVEEEAVERVDEEPTGGRGRPRAGYRARPGMARGGARRWRLLAEILLSQLATDAEPADSAERAGRAWGAHLIARPAPGQPSGAGDAADRLVAMLAELDFAPEPELDPEAEGRIRLRHCPFLELAEHHRDLVCTVHLGLMRGALAELDAPVAVTALEPFAEPADCIAHLRSTPRPTGAPR